VLFVLLGNWRAALLVTLTLPLSLALSGLLLRAGGVGINTMTLGGLAIAVGLLVDAAIIVTENIVHHLQQHPQESRREIALRASQQVARPILFATLMVAVFVPLFAMTGIEGRMYRPLAAAVVAALAASLVLALTLVPVAAAILLRSPARDADEDVWIVRHVKHVYAPLLDRAMRHAGVVQVVTIAITVPAIGLALLVGSDFMPQLDEGAFLLRADQSPLRGRPAQVRRCRGRCTADRACRAHGRPDAARPIRRTRRAQTRSLD
jgi:cobalt-zinc-cadmium resistance protein CzcA